MSADAGRQNAHPYAIGVHPAHDGNRAPDDGQAQPERSRRLAEDALETRQALYLLDVAASAKAASRGAQDDGAHVLLIAHRLQAAGQISQQADAEGIHRWPVDDELQDPVGGQMFSEHGFGLSRSACFPNSDW